MKRTIISLAFLVTACLPPAAPAREFTFTNKLGNLVFTDLPCAQEELMEVIKRFGTPLSGHANTVKGEREEFCYVDIDINKVVMETIDDIIPFTIPGDEV